MNKHSKGELYTRRGAIKKIAAIGISAAAIGLGAYELLSYEPDEIVLDDFNDARIENNTPAGDSLIPSKIHSKLEWDIGYRDGPQGLSFKGGNIYPIVGLGATERGNVGASVDVSYGTSVILSSHPFLKRDYMTFLSGSFSYDPVNLQIILNGFLQSDMKGNQTIQPQRKIQKYIYDVRRFKNQEVELLVSVSGLDENYTQSAIGFDDLKNLNNI